MVHVPGVGKNVYAPDAAAGAGKWTFVTGDTVFASPTVVDGMVHVGSRDGKVYAPDATTGVGPGRRAPARAPGPGGRWRDTDRPPCRYGPPP